MAIGLAISMTYLSVATADELSQAKFESLFLEPQVIGRFGMLPERFRSIGAKRHQDLLSARATLMAFFAATQTIHKDPRQYLGGSLVGRFKDRAGVGRELLGPETSVHVVSIIDFDTVEEDVLELKFYVVIFLEGKMIVDEDRARLRKIGTSWKIMQIGGIK